MGGINEVGFFPMINVFFSVNISGITSFSFLLCCYKTLHLKKTTYSVNI